MLLHSNLFDQISVRKIVCMHEIVIAVIHLETIFNHVRKRYPWCNSLSFTKILWSVIFFKFMPNNPTRKCKCHIMGPKENHHPKEMAVGDGKEKVSLYA